MLLVCLLMMLVVGLAGFSPSRGRVSAQALMLIPPTDTPTDTPTITPTPPPTPTQFTPPRGIEGDYWADRVIGQPDFASIAPNETTANSLFYVNGAIVYPSAGTPTNKKLLIYD